MCCRGEQVAEASAAILFMLLATVSIFIKFEYSAEYQVNMRALVCRECCRAQKRCRLGGRQMPYKYMGARAMIKPCHKLPHTEWLEWWGRKSQCGGDLQLVMGPQAPDLNRLW